MDQKTIKALVEAGAVKRTRIIANGGLFYVEFDTAGGQNTAQTGKGKPKTWASIDAAARWVRSLGMGSAQLHLERWQPGQRQMPL